MTTPRRQAELSDRQQATLDAITGYIDRHGYSPTVREVAGSLSVTVGAAHKLLVALRERGRI